MAAKLLLVAIQHDVILSRGLDTDAVVYVGVGSMDCGGRRVMSMGVVEMIYRTRSSQLKMKSNPARSKTKTLSDSFLRDT